MARDGLWRTPPATRREENTLPTPFFVRLGFRQELTKQEGQLFYHLRRPALPLTRPDSIGYIVFHDA